MLVVQKLCPKLVIIKIVDVCLNFSFHLSWKLEPNYLSLDYSSDLQIPLPPTFIIEILTPSNKAFSEQVFLMDSKIKKIKKGKDLYFECSQI